MAKVAATLKELRNAEVRFISLVDRAASRIPFRVLKRDKDEEMDLTKIFKSEEKPEEKPEVLAVVVYDYQDERAKAVKDAVTACGFATERVVKSDDGETVVYSQVEEIPEDHQVIRLSDQVVLAVKGFSSFRAAGSFAEMVAANGFYGGLDAAQQTLRFKLSEAMQAAEDPKSAASKVRSVIQDFSSYVSGLVNGLPKSAFDLTEMLEKAVAVNPISKEEAVVEKEEPVQEIIENKEEGAMEKENVEKKECAGKKMTEEEMMEEEKKKGAKKEDGSETPAEEKVEEKVTAEEKPAEEKVVQKTEMQTLLEMVQSIATKVDSVVKTQEDLNAKVTEVATKQESTQKVLDDVVKKSDTLEEKMNTTVTAPPNSPDTPVKGTVQKSDDDPRTGCFDTAFMRRKRY